MTSTEKYAIQSMAMDLKRVSLGIYNESLPTAVRFLKEAKARQREVGGSLRPKYINNILEKISKFEVKPDEKTAEDALMYSTILQNYSL